MSSRILTRKTLLTRFSSSNGHGINGGSGMFPPELHIDELDNIRLREITGKAVSGTLLLMLKWFKRSRMSTT